ncbi:MAG: WD40 repeat domain-containing protein [Actinomycetota bacterium]
MGGASGGRTLRVWDAETGDLLLTLAGHTDAVSACAWSPDGRRIASASRGRTLRVWDQTCEPLRTLAGHAEGVSACHWSPDGRRLASASEDGTLRLWDTGTAAPLLTLARHLAGHMGSVRACAWAWSSDGRRIASASYKQTLRVWFAETGEPLLTLAGHTGLIDACAWSPDGRRLASASGDGSLRIWDVTGDGEERIRIQSFGEEGWAGLDPANNRILWTQGEAWHRLGWLALDPERGVLERYPAEVFGPLPDRG